MPSACGDAARWGAGALRGSLKRRDARRRAFTGRYHVRQSASATPTGKPATRRRASRLLGLALILLTLALALPAGASAFVSSGGDGRVRQSWGSGPCLYDVAFSDAAHGWAVGEGGAIRATTDSGATWSAQPSGTTANLGGIAFTDATHGWAVGYDWRLSSGSILATADGGGATWIKQRSGSGAHLRAVAFTDAAHGWAVGDDGVILATTNGGATWSAQDPGSGPSQIARLKPPSGKRGALVTISGADFGAAQGAGAVRFGAKTCT